MSDHVCEVFLLLGIGERSAAMVTHLHEAEPKTGSGFLFLPYDTKPKLENVVDYLVWLLNEQIVKNWGGNKSQEHSCVS